MFRRVPTGKALIRCGIGGNIAHFLVHILPSAEAVLQVHRLLGSARANVQAHVFLT